MELVGAEEHLHVLQVIFSGFCQPSWPYWWACISGKYVLGFWRRQSKSGPELPLGEDWWAHSVVSRLSSLHFLCLPEADYKWVFSVQMHIMVCFFLGDGAVIIFGISPWVELTLYFGLISGSSFLMILHLYQNNDQWFIIDFYWLQKKKIFIFHYCQWYVLISFMMHVGIAWNLSCKVEVTQGYGSVQISFLYSMKDYIKSQNMRRFLILREMFTVGWFCLCKWPCMSAMTAILYFKDFSKILESCFHKLVGLVPGNDNCQHHLIVNLI